MKSYRKEQQTTTKTTKQQNIYGIQWAFELYALAPLDDSQISFELQHRYLRVAGLAKKLVPLPRHTVADNGTEAPHQFVGGFGKELIGLESGIANVLDTWMTAKEVCHHLRNVGHHTPSLVVIFPSQVNKRIK